MRLLPYLHPLWQIGALTLALWTLSLGLRMRALRRRRPGAERRGAEGAGSGGVTPVRAGADLATSIRDDRRRALLGRHVRAGLTFLVAICLGYTGGPLILGLAREEPVFRSAHAFFATLTLGLLLAGGVLGVRLWRYGAGPRARDLHVYCMGLGVFLGIVVAMLGLGLLP